MGDLVVTEGVTLTMPAGMEMVFTQNFHDLEVNGTLKALGTAVNRIRFYGNTGSASENGGNLKFFSTSSGNELNYVTVEGLGDGSSSYDASIYVDGAEMSIRHTEIIDNETSTPMRVTPRTPPLLTFEDNEIPTVHVYGGDVLADATWKLPDVSYTLMGDLTISEGVDLTLSPGLEIWLPDDSRDVFIDGTLKAIGLEEEPIRFYGSNPSSTEYGGTLVFSATSIGNELEHVIIERIGDGSNSYDAAVYADRATVSFKNCEFLDIPVRYVRVTAQTPQLLGFDNNILPTVHVTEGDIAPGATWAIPDSSYTLEDDLFVPEGDTLTLQPGTEIYFPFYSQNVFVSGTLIAIGTETENIRFWGSNPNNTQLEGFGGAIIFDGNSEGSILSFVELEEMGIPSISNYTYGGIITLSPSLSVQNCTFINCVKYGIYINGGSPSIKENCFESLVGITNFPPEYGIFATSNVSGTIDATNNYWGNASGPYNATNNSNGNIDIQVSDNILVIPFNEECLGSIEYDLGIVQLVAPTSSCDLTNQEEVTIQVVNAGLETQNNFEVGYILEGNPPVTETITTSLSSGEFLTHTFTELADLSEETNYNIEVFVSAVNDDFASNNQSTVEIFHYDEFEADISSDVAICESDCTWLTAGGGESYLWSTGSTFSSIYVCPAESTTYSVTVTNSQDCQDMQQVTVAILETPATPVITTSSDYLCQGGTVSLSTSASNFIWSTQETTPTITVTQAGLYSVTAVNSEGCTATSSVYISEVPIPTLVASDNGIICQGGSATITAFTGLPGGIFQWSTGQTTQSITVNPPATQTYSVTITTEGCTSTHDYTVTVEPDLPPGAISNMLPPNGATGIGLPVNFSWAPAENAASYDLYLGLEGSTPAFYASTTQINYVTYNLAYGNTYCWQVIPRSCSGIMGEPSAIQCFTIEYLPDLVVPSITTPTTTAFAGAEIEVEWLVQNVGLAPTSNNSRIDAVYLSDDENYDFSDDFLGNVFAQDLLNTNESVSNSSTVRLPECETGEFYLIVITDRWNYLQEESEDNNTGVSSVPITIQPSPTPDLRASGATTLDVAGFAQAGESYNLNFGIINDGDLATDGPFLVRIFIDTVSFYDPATADWLDNYSVEETLGVGQSTGPIQVEVTIPPNTASGDYYIHVVIDFNDAVEECVFEVNNETSTSLFSVLETPKPDFELLDVEVLPDTVRNNEVITVSYDLKNNGNGFEALLSDRIYICPSPDLNLPVTSIVNSGLFPIDNEETKQREVTFTIPGNITGKFYFLVYANQGNAIDETNYDNNFGIYDSVIVVSPNLTPANVTMPDNALAGQQITMNWNDKNIGEGHLLNANLVDRVYLSPDDELNTPGDALLSTVGGQVSIVSMDSISRSKNVMIPNETVPGDYYVIVETNASFTAYENANYDDNVVVSSGTISIAEGQYPDLYAHNITPAPTAVTAGESVVIAFEVNNDGGDGTAMPEWTDQIYRCTCSEWNPGLATLVQSVSHTQTLPVGGSYTKTFTDALPFSLPGGSYYYYVKTDAFDDVYEKDETDPSNVRRSANAVQVTGYSFENVDLTLQNVEPPCDVLPGQSATVYFESRNIGSTATVAGNWVDGIVLSSDNVWNPATDTLIIAQWPHTNNLAASQSYAGLHTFTLPSNLSGVYYVLLVTDLFNANNETPGNLSNNAALLPQVSCEGGGGDDPVIFPPKPDLTVDITDAPSTGVAGQPILIQYEVTNQSDVPATGSWVERAFLSTDMSISGALLGTNNAETGTLEPGENYSGQMEVTIPVTASGNYFLVLKTDAGNGIFEDNENNNLADQYLFVVQPPPSDLIVKSIDPPLIDTIATSMTVNWVVRNTGENPAEGLIYQGVYLSEDQAWDVSDVLLGTEDFFVALNPQQEATFSLTGRLEDVKRQDYYVIIRTDLQNNIPELDETNNSESSVVPTFVEVPEIVIDAPAITAGVALALPYFYRIEVAGNQLGETVRVTLESEDPSAFNELYLAYDQIPSRTVYDFGFDTPFSANQQILIPEVEPGTYYVLVYPVQGAPVQELSLKAETVPFEITTIEANEGGNTGLVTTRITGGKFTEDMEVWLDNGQDPQIFAQDLILVNSTVAYITFNLQGAAIGTYDVHGERVDPIVENTVLNNGFEVVAGTISNQENPLVASCSMDFGGETFIVLDVGDDLSPLVFGTLHQSTIRPGQVARVQVSYRNSGNINVPMPQRLFTSNGFPLSLSNGDFNENLQGLNLAFPFDTGSQSLLEIPPGETVTRTFYVRAQGDPGDKITIDIENLQ